MSSLIFRSFVSSPSLIIWLTRCLSFPPREEHKKATNRLNKHMFPLTKLYHLVSCLIRVYCWYVPAAEYVHYSPKTCPVPLKWHIRTDCMLWWENAASDSPQKPFDFSVSAIQQVVSLCNIIIKISFIAITFTILRRDMQLTAIYIDQIWRDCVGHFNYHSKWTWTIHRVSYWYCNEPLADYDEINQNRNIKLRISDRCVIET